MNKYNLVLTEEEKNVVLGSLNGMIESGLIKGEGARQQLALLFNTDAAIQHQVAAQIEKRNQSQNVVNDLEARRKEIEGAKAGKPAETPEPPKPSKKKRKK